MANDINIRIGAKLDGLRKGIQQANRELTRFANFAENTGRELTTRLTLPIIGAGTAAIVSFAKFERLELSLKALAEEGENASDTMARLQKIAQLPGIGLEQAIKGAAQLRTVGFSALQAEAALEGLAKAVTLSGEGPEQLQSVVRQLTQMSSKGRILQEDLGVILENVPSIGIALQDAFGTTSAEAIRNTGVSAQQFTAKIIKAIAANEKFQNVQGGVANELENFGLSVRLSLAELGRTIAETINLSELLRSVSGFINRATTAFKNLNPNIQKGIVYVAGFAAAVGPLVFGIGAAIKVATSFVGTLRLVGGTLTVLAANPIGAVVAAIGLVVVAFKSAYDSSERFRATIKGVVAVIINFAKTIKDALLAPFQAVGALLRGEFAEVENILQNALGFTAGETAGQAFARAYEAEIVRSRQAEQLSGRQVQTNTNVGGTNLDDIFSNLGGGSRGPVNVIDPIEVNKSIALVKSLQEATTGLAGELAKPIDELGLQFEALPSQISYAEESLLQYQERINQARDRSLAFGASFDLLGEKISLTQQAVDQAFADGFTSASENVQSLVAELEKLNRIETVTAGINALGGAIESMAENGALSFKSFASAAISAITDVIGALIKQGVAAAVANAFKNPAGIIPPVGLALAGLAGAGASALFKSLINTISPPKLAAGGIIPPGFSGDRFPALLNSGEAVIPINKLFDQMQEMFGGGGNFVLRGQDLVLAYDRASYSSNRIGG